MGLFAGSSLDGDERLSHWRIAEIVGRRRRSAFDDLRRWDIIPAPGDDGRWDPSVADRIRHAMELRIEARRFDRRVVLLHRDGYAISREVRRRALSAIVSRLSRPTHKVSQVLWERDAFFRRPVHRAPRARILRDPGLDLDQWPRVFEREITSDALFDKTYQWCAMFVDSFEPIGKATGIPVGEALRYEERLALLIVVQLIEERYVRNRLGQARVRRRER